MSLSSRVEKRKTGLSGQVKKARFPPFSLWSKRENGTFGTGKKGPIPALSARGKKDGNAVRFDVPGSSTPLPSPWSKSLTTGR
jgi:hypothetical protein